MAITKTAQTIVSNQSLSAGGSAIRGRLDLASKYGGFLTIKMVNGGTLGAQCVCNVLIAHNASLPSAGAAGTDWKTIASYGSGTTSGVTTEVGLPIDPSIMHLEVEFSGNTTNAVTVEAFLSELTSV